MAMIEKSCVLDIYITGMICFNKYGNHIFTGIVTTCNNQKLLSPGVTRDGLPVFSSWIDPWDQLSTVGAMVRWLPLTKKCVFIMGNGWKNGRW